MAPPASPKCDLCGALDENCEKDFDYAALDEERGEFRVIRLVHDEDEEPDGGRESPGIIRAELLTNSLYELGTARIPFAALSYCWGTEEPTLTIQLNGQPFRIRPTLYAFLRQSYGEPQILSWFIDAICINQHDLSERANQVRVMGDVYRSTPSRGLARRPQSGIC